jgi:hypothetical protein
VINHGQVIANGTPEQLKTVIDGDRIKHPARCIHPRRATPTGHGSRHLAQLDDRPDQQTINDRVRSLTPTSRNHSSKTNVKDSATKDR